MQETCQCSGKAMPWRADSRLPITRAIERILVWVKRRLGEVCRGKHHAIGEARPDDL